MNDEFHARLSREAARTNEQDPTPTSEKRVIAMWPELHWRLDHIDARHAFVTVFDHGANAGTLVLDRNTWELMARYDRRLIPDSVTEP